MAFGLPQCFLMTGPAVWRYHDRVILLNAAVAGGER